MDEDDSVEAYTGKIFESAMVSLSTMLFRQSLDKSAVNRAVDLLTGKKSPFGLGFLRRGRA